LQRPVEKLLFKPNSSGRLSVCLAYPNEYRVAMANLGYQAVYRILATTPGVVCERVCLPVDGTRPASVESGRSPGDFDVLAFSLSFESDYPNIIRMLDAAGIPARTEQRRASGRDWPLLVAGGPATFLNPEPVAPFFDLFLIGEGEEMIPEAFTAAAGSGLTRRELLAQLSSVEGAYRPDRYRPVYEDADGRGDLIAFEPLAGAPARVGRRYIEDLDRYPTTTSVIAPDSVFGDYYLVEASRGCEWGCRFCAAGFMYRPVRHRSAAGVTRDALAGLADAAIDAVGKLETVGLVGAEMASHPGIASTCERVVAAGGRVSPSSLKADMISARLAAALGAGGTRSATVAPEAGSERMRRVINKNLTEEEILRATDLLVGEHVDSLKLYFMCALPTETQDDLQGIVDLTASIRERMIGTGRARGRIGGIKVSVNPFVPKPWTPFQWEAMLPVSEAQLRIAGLRRSLGRLPNVTMESESPREAYLQTLLSRGDRRVADIVESLARSDQGWWQQLQAMRRGRHESVDLDPDRFVTHEYATDALLPWDFIDHHIDKRYLLLERRRAFAERETEPCDVSTCRTCGAC
jgi:radical SAM superfamily enzyme YgiQ (UPF0313 family)